MSKKYDFLKFGNGHEFEQPDFVNHMCHWAPWADHFQDAPGDMGTLACMLGFSLEENKRLCDRLGKFNKAQAALLFHYIELVETGRPRPFEVEETTLSIKNAWRSIQLLNDWRRNNKLNIRAVDVT